MILLLILWGKYWFMPCEAYHIPKVWHQYIQFGSTISKPNMVEMMERRILEWQNFDSTLTTGKIITRWWNNKFCYKLSHHNVKKQAKIKHNTWASRFRIMQCTSKRQLLIHDQLTFRGFIKTCLQNNLVVLNAAGMPTLFD